MARARRRTLIPRLRVPETARDLAWNKIELNRILATERLDPDAALMMLWAMDLTAETLRAESTSRPRRAQNRACNPNEIYDVALNPLFPRSLSATLSQMIENTTARGRGYPPPEPDAARSLPRVCMGLRSTQADDDYHRSTEITEALCPQCLRGESSRTGTELSSPRPSLTRQSASRTLVNRHRQLIGAHEIC